VSDERERVAKELRSVVAAAHREALQAGDASLGSSPLAVVAKTPALPRLDAAVPLPLPAPPDPSGVNATWKAEPPAGGRVRKLFERLLSRLFRPRFEAQQAFNARQVQLDNAILAYLNERFAATHQHYDRVLGLYGRHIEEIDERHLMLQEALVSSVHDLVRRIDIVLAEVNRDQLSRNAALEELRTRVAALEEALQRRA
jgi:hypothetical protein